jgi:hypothetical protein
VRLTYEREALMIEASSPDSAAKAATTNGKPAGEPNPELARVIEARVLQGYRLESLSEERAVLVVKGRKRLFGMRGGQDKKTELRIGEHGRVVTRNI